MALINQPCAVSRPGVPPVVTPRRRVVLGGRWQTINGRRCYHVNTRWLCEYVQVWRDASGITHIVVASALFSEWELRPVAALESEAA